MEIKTDCVNMGSSNFAKFNSTDHELAELTRRLTIQQNDNRSLTDFVNRRELWLEIYKQTVNKGSNNSNDAKIRANAAVNAYDEQFKVNC